MTNKQIAIYDAEDSLLNLEIAILVESYPGIGIKDISEEELTQFGITSKTTSTVIALKCESEAGRLEWEHTLEEYRKLIESLVNDNWE